MALLAINFTEGATHSNLLPGPPKVPLSRALWYVLVGIWGLLKGSWGVLVFVFVEKGPEIFGLHRGNRPRPAPTQAFHEYKAIMSSHGIVCSPKPSWYSLQTLLHPELCRSTRTSSDSCVLFSRPAKVSTRLWLRGFTLRKATASFKEVTLNSSCF